MAVVGAVAAGLFRARTVRAGFGSVAVLPFANATGVADDDYLSEGITESLINSVSRVPGIRVLARTTVYKFREEPDPRKAGRDLSVDAVVTGRVRRQGQDLVVQAELVRVSDGAQIWGDRVTERVSDAAPAAAGFALRIAHSLQPRLTGAEEKSLGERPHDAQAWDLTLRGRYFLNRRRDEDIGRSLDLFQQALARDPNEAAAWLGLADVFNLLGYYGVKAPKDVIPKQREAAARAIALDPALSGAHSSLAEVLYEYEGDFPGAEREFRQALALNPNDAQAHQWYSNFLSASSRFEESLVEIRKARELDPLNVTINVDVGLAFYWAGDPARALPELKRALELDPTSPFGHLWMGLALFRTGSRERGIAEWAKAVELSDRSPDALAFWGYGCGRTGRTAEAEAALKELEGLARKRFVSAFPFAVLTLGLDRKAEALAWFEKAYEERAGRLVYLNVERGFDPLRAEPRFREVVRKLGLPPVR
jgi:serine/threonine-protein kinase